MKNFSTKTEYSLYFIAIIFMVTIPVTFALAFEMPVTADSKNPVTSSAAMEPVNQSHQSAAPEEPIRIENQKTNPAQPVWAVLENMSTDTKANSNIDIELGSNSSAEAKQLAERIAGLWNTGDYSKALQLFRQLNSITDDIAIGNCWRTPLTNGDALWGTDVQIGTRELIVQNEFDKHWGTGNLFVILLYIDSPRWYWTVNFSDDNGDSWSETYQWWATYEINSIGTTVLSDWCYVGYPMGTTQDEARIRRFNTSDGSSAIFPDSSTSLEAFTRSASINEIVLTSNHDWYDNIIYYYVLCADSVVTFYWDDRNCEGFDEIVPGITDAREGLDATCNEGYSDHYQMLSYLNYSDQVSIWRFDGNWDNIINYNVNSVETDYTAIGAYHDTITCAFDYHNGSNMQCRYLVNHNGGNGSWYYNDVGASPDTTAQSPDIACRRGGGTGIVYRFHTTRRDERFLWRNYVGSWSSPDIFNDYVPYYNKPNIEYLGDGHYGVVYIGTSGLSAWFDKCTARSCLDISMVNHGPDPVHAGDRFRIQGILENTCGVPQTTDVWYGVHYSGTFYEQGSYLNLTVQPNDTLTGMFWQNVPGYAPPGGYTYVSYYGDYATGTVEGSCMFNFGIMPPLAGGEATEWSTISGMFGGYEVSSNIPGEYVLHSNFPNPFNATTNISYDLPYESKVTLEVFNLMGQKVATLVDGCMSAGNQTVSWDASQFSSGIYYYKLTAGDMAFTKRMTLLK